MVEEKSKSIKAVRDSIATLSAPVDLFRGVCLDGAFVPDNIILFRRTHTHAFAPEGVSNNFHHRFELVVVLEKGGPVRVGNASHRLEQGEAVLIFPNEFHHYLDVENGEMDWLFITFECKAASVIKALQNRPRVLNDSALVLLRRIAESYKGAWGNLVDALDLSHCLGQFLLAMRDLPAIPMQRMNTHSTDDVRDKLLERINSFVRTNLHRRITLADIGKELGYSESHMRAVFRDRLGVSLGRYIRESQLSVAAEMLQSTDFSVTEVANRTSFNSLFAFSRAFKAAYGMPPKAYSRMISGRIVSLNPS